MLDAMDPTHKFTFLTAENSSERIRYYRVICCIGCAAIRCVYHVDWRAIADHLRCAVKNDDADIGPIRYSLSYALWRCAEFKESKAFYDRFEEYLRKGKATAEEQSKLRMERERNGNVERSEDDERLKLLEEAWTSDEWRESLKWKPIAVEKKDGFLETFVDCMAVSMVIFIVFSMVGTRPYFGEGLFERGLMLLVLAASCSLVTPSLGITMFVTALPIQGDDFAGFDHIDFLTKWVCACGITLFFSCIVIGRQVPLRKAF